MDTVTIYKVTCTKAFIPKEHLNDFLFAAETDENGCLTSAIHAYLTEYDRDDSGFAKIDRDLAFDLVKKWQIKYHANDGVISYDGSDISTRDKYADYVIWAESHYTFDEPEPVTEHCEPWW